MNEVEPAGEIAAFLMDTENVFWPFGWDSVQRRIDSLTSIIGASDLVTLEIQQAKLEERAGEVLASLIAWSKRRAAPALQPLDSFGKNEDPGVKAVLPHIRVLGIDHFHVGRETHAAEDALIKEFHQIEPRYPVFVFVGTDIRVRQAIRDKVEVGWTKRFLFVAPPDARLNDSRTGTYRALNAAPGAVLSTSEYGRYFAYINEIHTSTVVATRTSKSGKSTRRQSPPNKSVRVGSRLTDSASNPPHDGAEDLATDSPPPPLRFAIPLPDQFTYGAQRWAMEGNLPMPTSTHPLGSAHWRERLTENLARTPQLKYASERIANLLEQVYVSVPDAKAQLEALVIADDRNVLWKGWSAAALLFPQVQRGLRPQREPFRKPYELAKSWALQTIASKTVLLT